LTPAPSYATRIARTVGELEELRAVWETIPWERDEAEYEYLLTRVRTRPNVLGPFAIVVEDGERVLAALAGRLEQRRLETAVGYRVLYAPEVKLVQAVDGGVVVPDPEGLEPLLDAVRGVLAGGEADALALPPLELGSPLAVSFESLSTRLARQRFVAPWTRRRLVLPTSFNEFVATRSPNTRWRIRREARRLAEEFGPDLTVEIVRDPSGFEQLVRDADRVARSTYQRALGAGFSDTPEQRALARVGLEHSWLRGYLLYLRGEPIAYWLCSLHGETMLIRTGGYDGAYAEHRVGIHLLMSVIEDAIADPSLRILDFGPGDAAYKQQFSNDNDSRQERNLLVFAPTFRAIRINAVRGVILGSARLVRRMLDAAKLTDRVRARWRDRLTRIVR
jgi:Acetyltransferase (GNAT) domain